MSFKDGKRFSQQHFGFVENEEKTVLPSIMINMQNKLFELLTINLIIFVFV